LPPPKESQDLCAKRDELIFELIKRRLDDEASRISSLDSKAANLIGVVSVVVGLLLSVATVTLPALVSNLISALPYFMGASLLIASIVFALLAFRVRKWITIPDVEYLRDEYTKLPYEEVLKRNAGEMVNAVVDTQKKNNTKAQMINWSWYCLVIGLAIVLVSVILLTMYGTTSSDTLGNLQDKVTS
jgi:hypothetical protein